MRDRGGSGRRLFVGDDAGQRRVDVGRGALNLSEFEDILLSADLSRAKTIAPPQGLVLERVCYPNENDQGGIEAVRK